MASVRTHPISFERFEALVTSGELKRRGDEKIKNAQSTLHTQRLNSVDVMEAPKSLAPGDVLTRVWQSKRPGLLTKLGLEDFLHHEVCTKVAPQQLDVIDKFEWQDGRSTASRRYVVKPQTTNSIQREVDDWDIRMDGLSDWMRVGAQKAMRVMLPRDTEKYLAQIIKEDNSPNKRAA